MSIGEQLNSADLLEQAREMGLIDTNLSAKCTNCNVIFPKEYNNCPKCQNSKFNITVLWE